MAIKLSPNSILNPHGTRPYDGHNADISRQAAVSPPAPVEQFRARESRDSFKSGSDQQGRQYQQKPEAKASPYQPNAATENFVPSSASLKTMVSSAVADARQGRYWDRGSI